MLRNNTTTDDDNAGMGHGADIDSSLPSTIDSSFLSHDVDNIIPSRSTTTAVRIVRKLSRDFFRARLLEHFGIFLGRKVIRWPSRIGLPLSDKVRVVLRRAPYAEQIRQWSYWWYKPIINYVIINYNIWCVYHDDYSVQSGSRPLKASYFWSKETTDETCQHSTSYVIIIMDTDNKTDTKLDGKTDTKQLRYINEQFQKEKNEYELEFRRIRKPQGIGQDRNLHVDRQYIW
jgi:hypothetical protein